MGIDIYMRWDGQTADEEQAQYTGFDIDSGGVGYLREAYHGDTYATKYLLKEAFEDHYGLDDGVEIPCEILRERLSMTLKMHIKRHSDTYKEIVYEDDPSAQSFVKFVELAERLTAENKRPKIIASY